MMNENNFNGRGRWHSSSVTGTIGVGQGGPPAGAGAAGASAAGAVSAARQMGPVKPGPGAEAALRGI